jgi:hypothetical protein
MPTKGYGPSPKAVAAMRTISTAPYPDDDAGARREVAEVHNTGPGMHPIANGTTAIGIIARLMLRRTER